MSEYNFEVYMGKTLLSKYSIENGGDRRRIVLGRGEFSGDEQVRFISESGRIEFSEPSVSREHGEFVFENGEIMYKDLGSTNGSYDSQMREISEVRGKSLDIMLQGDIRVIASVMFLGEDFPPRKRVVVVKRNP